MSNAQGLTWSRRTRRHQLPTTNSGPQTTSLFPEPLATFGAMATRSAGSLTTGDFKPDSFRGSAGFFRVGQTRSGQWWLVDPNDRPFFFRGVCAVNRAGRIDGRSQNFGAYALAVDALHGGRDPLAFSFNVVHRLHQWHFNAFGPGASPELFEQGLPYTEVLDFKKVGPTIHVGAAWLPDVFDPAWS